MMTGDGHSCSSGVEGLFHSTPVSYTLCPSCYQKYDHAQLLKSLENEELTGRFCMYGASLNDQERQCRISSNLL